MDVVKYSIHLLCLCFVACGPAPEMPVTKSASVELLDAKDEKGFYLLPLKGDIFNAQKFWSGDYWALSKGNINIRWNSAVPDGWSYLSPTREQLLFMMPEEIAELSPTEKFDLYLGRYDYPLKENVYSQADRYALDWEGICNGWAPASMNHNEPTPKIMTNPDGITISFGSSDIKALLSYYYAFIHKSNETKQLGRLCPRANGWFNWNEDCKNDLNAGSFHIVMANKVGKQNESFMVDIDRYKEVWNHPIVSYVSRVESEVEAQRDLPAGTFRVLNVRTKVSYVDESEKNSWERVIGTDLQKLIVREYRYYLYLDSKNDIIGGEWKSEDRPDFLWVMEPASKFLSPLENLSSLLND
jgi:hypothetical protein